MDVDLSSQQTLEEEKEAATEGQGRQIEEPHLLQVESCLDQEKQEEEISQTGPSKAASYPSSVEKEKDSPAVGDEEISSSQQTVDDLNPSETDGPKWRDPTLEEGIERDESGADVGELEQDQCQEMGFIFISNDPPEPDEPNHSSKPMIVISDADDDSTEDEEDDSRHNEHIPADGPDGDDEKKRGGGDDRTVVSKYPRPTKIVLRLLPPKITNQEFIDSVSPLPEYDYIQVENPDPEWGQATSVAHINFVDPDDAIWFIERFTGYQFIDENGESFIGICDFAMSQKVFRMAPNKVNTERGKLLEEDDYVEFVRKYEEDPFAFTMRLPQEVATAEEMLTEIENRPKHKGPEPTPLTEFILNKKSRREAERKLRKDKERELRKLERIRRDKEKEADREQRKEKKRERRDKERRERREREKMERDATAKGMTLTYSKSGKATRWSANSGPFTKKTEVEKENERSEEAAENKDSKIKPLDVAPSQKERNDKEIPKPKFEESGFGKKKPVNPFSKDVKKIDRPVREDKTRFGKPFPAKSETSVSKSEAVSSSVGDKKGKSESTSSSGDNKPAMVVTADLPKREEPNVTGSGEILSETQPKKKIIRKIIRVKKVKKPEEDGEGVGTTTADTKLVVRKVVPSRSSASKKDDGKSNNASSSSKMAPVKIESKDNPSKSDAGTKQLSAEMNHDTANEKRRRARPDMQIYRPGSLRTAAKDKPPPRNRDKPASDAPACSSADTPKNPLTTD